MITFFSFLILSLAFLLLFIVQGAILYAAMIIANVQSSFRGFLLLNLVMTAPFMFLNPLLAILLATILFWSLVFKVTYADHLFNVLMMLLCVNVISFFVGDALTKKAAAYAREHELLNDPQDLDITKGLERRFEGRAADGADDGDSGKQVGEGIRTDQLTIELGQAAPGALPSAMLVGKITNLSETPTGPAVVSYDFKSGIVKGFGTVTLPPFAPKEGRTVRVPLTGSIMPALEKERDFATFSAE